MPRKQGNARWKTMAGILILSASALGLAGCKALTPEHLEIQTEVMREASRDQLLAMLDEQSKLVRLSATTRVSIFEESSVMPATVMDAMRKESNKPYRKRFAQAEVNGSFHLLRDVEGHQDVRMSGEVQGVNNVGFTLLGKDRSFWMLIPTTEAERNKTISEDPTAPRGKVLYGTCSPDALRPRDRYSLRPQDFANLLFMSEAKSAIDGQVVCYVEKWPEYYVMTFLRQDWTNHIYSKIWIERHDLGVAIHQLFDSSGELVAEARFKLWGRYPIVKGSKVKLDIPTQVDFLWPRDRILMRAAFDGIKVNDVIPAKVFDETLFQGYPTEVIEAPSAR